LREQEKQENNEFSLRQQKLQSRGILLGLCPNKRGHKMKNSQIAELYFVVGSPFRYYMFVLLTMFGGWNIAQDLMNIIDHKMPLREISVEYVSITILSLIGFYFVRKNAIKKLQKLEKK